MKSLKSQALLSRYSTLVIFLIPALTVFTLFVVLPIGEAAYYSFFSMEWIW
jgi:raffinose/stachyose/melibiose transport system permease protein